MMSWKRIPNEHLNGVLQGYILAYENVKGVESIRKELRLPAFKTSQVITNLRPAMNYTFTIRGFTSVGRGAISEPKVQDTEEYGKK